jgi:hypothetical protein
MKKCLHFLQNTNASLHLLPEAGARNERRLEAVRCKALLDVVQSIASYQLSKTGRQRPETSRHP